jgi:zinc/manganese transport system ATP-binding protein
MTVALELHDLTVAYHGHPAVHHVSGVFQTGSLTAIVGPNGAGKSTLLNAIAGIRRPTEGRITCGPDFAAPGAIALLAQLSSMNPDFPLRVLEVVAMGAWVRVGAFGALNGRERQRIGEALHQVGLDGFEDRLVDELSVGQLQRVLFARLIVQDAPLILLDEPFSALDAATTRDLLAVMHRWQQQGRTVVAVLHDFDMVRHHFPQTLLIARELIGWGLTPEVLTAANLRQSEQRSLAWQGGASWCEVAPAHERSTHAHKAH